MEIIRFFIVFLLTILLTACQKQNSVSKANLLFGDSFKYAQLKVYSEKNWFDDSEIYAIRFDNNELNNIKKFLNTAKFKVADNSDSQFFIKRISEVFNLKTSDLKDFILYRGDYTKTETGCDSGCSVYFLLSNKDNKAYIEFFTT